MYHFACFAFRTAAYITDFFITIYPLVQTVNALYLQLLEMHKAFVGYCQDQNPDNLPTSNEIAELQTSYNNMLSAIIDLLDGAKYLWEGGAHNEQ